MTIYYKNPEYNVSRSIIGKVPGVAYRRVHTLSAALEKLRYPHANCLALGLLQLRQKPLGGGGMHFFNTVAGWPFKFPFVTTFETSVPRTARRDFWFRRALDGLRSDACRRLLAMSECARRIQLRVDAEQGIEEVDEKIEVLHPPQAALVQRDEIAARDFEKGPLRFFFVGSAFARKGGGEILRVFNRLRKDCEIELTIIGDFASDDRYMCHPTLDAPDALRRLADGRDWIRHDRRVPNDRVLAMMRESHVGLLPTRQDTYGYSVLEMQAAGLPVVTSNVRALPEINSNEVGWMFDVEKNEDGNFPETTPEGVERLSAQIEAGLERCVRDVCEHRAVLRERALRAYDRVRAQHDPDAYARRLGKVYDEAFGNA